MQESPSSRNSAPPDLLQRLLAKDASLWSDAPEQQESIRNRLGWLTLHDTMAVRRAELDEFAREVRARRYERAVLLGMGGSSLAPEVFQATFGNAPGCPALTVLDTSDPSSILDVERSLDLARTLFIVSSKSGTTLESQALFRYFAAKCRPLMAANLDNFIAITDPGTPLEELAARERFWRCFLNPPDVGGRYSAISYFGLVPAAIIGVDIKLLLDSARSLDPRAGVGLGFSLAELAQTGRDKVTFLPGGLNRFGAWAEQLLAESTGKQGKGLIPVDGEPLASPSVYGDDRVFVRLQLGDRPDGLDEAVHALVAAGHPVVTIELQYAYGLGAEFLRWEIATAIAGALMRINPFDQPNVQEAKDMTAAVLTSASLDPDVGGETLTPANGPLVMVPLRGAPRGGYFAIQAYIQRNPQHDELLARLRSAVRFATRLATTGGYGPRYLHSTGQLHKGGPDKGIFLQLINDDPEELPIPESPYGFRDLKRAQAVGDLRALQSKGRRVMRLNLGPDPTAGLATLLDSIQQSAAPAAVGISRN
ncbi:MAG TPA: glucose-6-phosphate isomerase [Dehalococcoidia bacterium]|nr:glucose-6-phosphate isomerase [Dehalococcoidia bacterium]